MCATPTPDLSGTFCHYNPQSTVTLTLHDVSLSTSTQGDHVEGQEGVSEWERDEEIRPHPLQTLSFVGATLAVAKISMAVTGLDL